MMRSMMSAVAGLRAQQTGMDVIGNNVGNVNTAGFKSSSTQYEDLFYQTLTGATDDTNPAQVGYGAQVSGVVKNMSSAGSMQTDNPWNLYIDGGGYFTVASDPNSKTADYYTRVGNFTFNKNGYLVDPSGKYIMGTTDDSLASATPALQPVCLQDYGTNKVKFVPNDATAASPGAIEITPDVYSKLENISFNNDGSISVTYNSKTGTITLGDPKFDANNKVTNKTKVAISKFVNEYGLSQVGNNNFVATQASGAPALTEALNGNTTRIRGNALEMSNVDVAKEFTNMITTQRGFQANSRVITTSDSMLEELVNLKRS